MLTKDQDIYAEPKNVDPDTLNNLGPLRPMAGIWLSAGVGADVNLKPEGPRSEAFNERIELQPIDPQTNGPQLFYGLRYHQHIVRPGEVIPSSWLLALGTGDRNNSADAGDSPRPDCHGRRRCFAQRDGIRTRGQARLNGRWHLFEFFPRRGLPDC